MKNLTCGVLLLAAALGAQSDPAGAGEVDVVNVVVRQSTAGVYRFDVTLRHADEGWGHYADGWEIRDGDGAVLATRGLGGVRLPDALAAVTVAGHDSVHGYGGKEMTVDLPR